MIQHHTRALLALLISLSTLTLGCGENKLTQVILVVDMSDYAVPAEIDFIAVYLHTATEVNNTPVASDSLVASESSNRTLGFVLESDRLTDYTVEVEGRVGGSSGTLVVTERAVFDFVPDQTNTIMLSFHAACMGVDCCGPGDGGSCTEVETCDVTGACVPADYSFASAPLLDLPDAGL